MIGVMKITVVTILVSLSFASDVEAKDVSFRNDVMAVISKAGCNLGTCHAKAGGKGGFSLSLRGERPKDDFFTISRALRGRRINRTAPDQSLILLKATGQIPHEGRKRFDVGSVEYKTLRQWIADGARADAGGTAKLVSLVVTPGELVVREPETVIQIKAIANFSDGTTRDVTRLAVYELTDLMQVRVSPTGLAQRLAVGETTVIVRYLHLQRPVRLAFVPARKDFNWANPGVNNFIDMHVQAKLRKLRINPSLLVSDELFIRRLSLDLLGVIPTAEEVTKFTTDQTKDKRAKLIDAFLKRSEFADFWALKWSDILRNEEKVLDSIGVKVYHEWIRKSIADGKPMDQFARELIRARGSTYKNPPANFYRALRTTTGRAEATAQLFLGTRLQCAKCHNHPFEKWTQDDYYGFAALFGQIKYKIIKNKRRDKFDKNQFIGEQIVQINSGMQLKDPRNGKSVSPRFLGVAKGKVGKDRLSEAANWIASARNPLFAKVMVNRVWFHMMGRGIVDPIDDFRLTNPPVNPALLDALATHFVKHKFDLRQAVRVIANSRAYQTSSVPNTTNATDQRNFSRAILRRLTAEQMIDSISRAVGRPTRFNGFPDGTRAVQIPGVNKVYRDKKPSAGDRFLKLFGKPDRLLNCDCERSNETTLGQIFELTSGDAINALVKQHKSRIDALLAAKSDIAFSVDALFMASLSRHPTKKELAGMTKHVQQARDKRAAYEDVMWSLLNSKEFIFRR